MVPFNLTEDYVDKIKKDRLTPKKTAEQLSFLCICGIFNTERATKLLTELAKQTY